MLAHSYSWFDAVATQTLGVAQRRDPSAQVINNAPAGPPPVPVRAVTIWIAIFPLVTLRVFAIAPFASACCNASEGLLEVLRYLPAKEAESVGHKSPPIVAWALMRSSGCSLPTTHMAPTRKRPGSILSLLSLSRASTSA